jgi:hypothetical protein
MQRLYKKIAIYDFSNSDSKVSPSPAGESAYWRD